MLTAAENEFLTRVGPSTPGGELPRCYWHPVAMAADLPPENPTKFVRILGEDLVLFQTTNGEVGLLHDRCAHRGAVLYREMLKREIQKDEQHFEPMNVFRDPNHAIIDTKMEESLDVGKAGFVRYHVPPAR
jgi:hypothetical protein